MRRWLIDAIPDTMHMAIAGGLGLFIAMLGLKGGGLIVSNPYTLLSLGNVHSATVILFFNGNFDAISNLPLNFLCNARESFL